MKYHIEKNTVQEALVNPLFGRLVYSSVGLFHKLMIRFCDSLVRMKIVKLEFKGSLGRQREV